jgi:NAD(P)-dependent dehydrogenase (short-subunit alcohol dehydrogenase family)
MVARMDGKVAIVTGGGGADLTSIGASICAVLGREGGAVVLADRDRDGAERVRSLLAAEGIRVSVAVADVTRPDDCAAAVSSALADFGRLDVLVNNVGIPGKKATVVEVDQADWDRVISTNLGSVALMSRFAIPAMADGGAIVNVSSIAALRESDRAAYSASKGAVISLTTAMASQHAIDGIRVNCVAPGQVWTPAVALTFPGTAEEIAVLRRKRRLASILKTEGTAYDIAFAVLYLASDEARWVTGQTLVVDGGLSVGRPPAEDFDPLRRMATQR